MVDPLAQVVGLLQPDVSFSKHVEGAGAWRVRREETGRPFYCALLEGGAELRIGGQEPILLRQGDFVLVPSAYDFSLTSLDPVPDAHLETTPVALHPGHYWLGDLGASPTSRAVVGYCVFGSTNAALLVSLLPQFVHVRDEERLMTLVQLVDDEARGVRPARDVILARLVEVLLIEALRSAGARAPSGLLRGLADDRVATSLRLMHERPTQTWTVATLAKEAALSRSAFFDRFRRTVGVAPMEYLLHWRMALAKDLLRRGVFAIAEVAERVGYSSASTFSVAFARHAGLPPAAYARAQAAS